MDKQICIDIANEFRVKKDLEIVQSNKVELSSIKLFSELWRKFGLSEYDLNVGIRNFSYIEKHDCLNKWAENIFPPKTIDINFILRKVLNGRSSISFEEQGKHLSATTLVLFELENEKIEVDFYDLVPFEIDSIITNIKEVHQDEIDEMRFKDYAQYAELNLSYSNDNADKNALMYYKMALEINPTNIEVKLQYEILDKIVNHKNYNYKIDNKQTIELSNFFVDCCNIKGAERLDEIISDEFVCISRHFGRTKKAFISSLFLERISMMGLWTEIFQYENKDRLIPCVKLNDYGVLFFNIENEKIIRAFEYKIDEKLNRNKLTKWKS